MRVSCGRNGMNPAEGCQRGVGDESQGRGAATVLVRAPEAAGLPKYYLYKARGTRAGQRPGEDGETGCLADMPRLIPNVEAMYWLVRDAKFGGHLFSYCR